MYEYIIHIHDYLIRPDYRLLNANNSLYQTVLNSHETRITSPPLKMSFEFGTSFKKF